MTNRLQGRRILITGAAAGIGRACANACLAEGSAVALIDRDQDRLKAAALDLERTGQVYSLALDISDQGAAAAGVDELVRALGGLDGVVNSAGIDLHQPFAATAWQDWAQVMAINLNGPMHVCHAALDALKSSGHGAIVNIASGAGLRPIPDRVAYCVSKAALIMATKALALDLAPHGIRANVVCPGAVDTELFRHSLGSVRTIDDVKALYAMKRIGKASEIAAAVVFLVSEEASFVTGAALAVDGGRVFH